MFLHCITSCFEKKLQWNLYIMQKPNKPLLPTFYVFWFYLSLAKCKKAAQIKQTPSNTPLKIYLLRKTNQWLNNLDWSTRKLSKCFYLVCSMKDEGKNFYCCYNKLLFFLTIRLWLVSHCLNIYGQRQRLQLELGYRFSFFFLSSFKWILAYQLYALKELQKLDNKHLYLNTVERSYRNIFRSSIWTAIYSKQDWTCFQSRRLRNKQVYKLLYKMVLL